MHCRNSCENSVIEKLKKISTIKEIQGVFGIYDIIIKIETNDKKTFIETISSQIRTIDKLKSTLTLMISNPDGEYL
ncbi:MAG: Lrp/AsnC ligand binding domain-containing protein [Nitrosopumilus sp.]|nr:Lrp/AsnC ligand binding domain-containing protein [Nitrosopumilus sp.]